MLAVSLGMKFDLNDEHYDSSFDKIASVVCRIARDNIGENQIIDEMQWDRIENSARFTDDENLFHGSLSHLIGTHKAEALCEISLSDKGVLPIKIAEKVGKIIRDLIEENHIHYN